MEIYLLPKSTDFMRGRKQHGVTLIELLVGIVIGLLTVAVAMGALMVSRSVTGTVSDSSLMQQQASFAFRVIGQQIRQAGSLRLNLASQKNDGAPIDMADTVAFETKANGFDPAINTISGIDSPSANEYKLTVGYRNYTEPVYTSSAAASMLRDCLGQSPSDTLVQSRFTLMNNELRCAGATGSSQAIIQNVANFQVRYLQQTETATGIPKISYVNSQAAQSNWSQVTGVEVCLVLYGNEPINVDGVKYLDCDGSTEVSLDSLTAPRTKRAHIVFRNVYQIRSQGLISAS